MSIYKLKFSAVALIAAAIVGLGLAGCSGGSDPATSTVRTTEYGHIEGVVSTDGKTMAWLGVPYAKPPVGALRWKPTQAPDSWTGVKATKDYCDACPQVGGLYGPFPKGKTYSALSENFFKAVGSEDCLYLNIWRPATSETNLPVLVYIHGGSNVVGLSYDPMINGDNLAHNANIIVITIAYRLGHLGWFSHPAFKTGEPLNDSGNLALLDMIQALKFIKNNIANFGGNPGNVTISGQSAGSVNVYGLILSPLAAGLFHKAFSLSGGYPTSTQAAQEAKANALINAFLIKDGYATDKATADAYRTAQSNTWIRNYLMSKSSADLINIQVDPKGGKWGTGSRTFEPGSTTATLWAVVANVQDGTVLPANINAAIAAGNFNKVPQLVGGTAEEGKLFSGVFKVDDFTRFRWMINSDPDGPALFSLGDIVDGSLINPLTVANYNVYCYNNANGVIPGPSISTFVFHWLIDTSNTAFAPHVPIYTYMFKWNKQPAPWNDVYGAWHCGDIPFIFGTFNKNLNSFGWSKANEAGRLALANVMQKSLAAFMRTGNPNNSTLGVTWDPWVLAAKRQMGFDASNTAPIIVQE